jgi:uncharacterized protein YkwD
MGYPVRPLAARRSILTTRATQPGLVAIFVLLLGLASLGQPSPAAAFGPAVTTASTMDSQILTSLNNDRLALKLAPLRLDSRLIAWSADRAAWMASHALLTHTSYGGSPCNLYVIEKITWYQCGEAIANTTASFGAKAATALYALWRASPDHYALITSKTFNYVGIGVAYRAANHTTYASILFLEGPEHNRPIPSWTESWVSGTTVHWGWTAREPILQTHTAAIRSFDLELRTNSGSWHLLRTNSTDVSATFRNLPPGSTWQIQIRARDSVGNLSGWLTSSTLTVH